MVRDPSISQAPKRRRQLLHLPDEILLSVLSYVTQREDLVQVLLTNQHLNRLAEPFLYNTVEVTHGDQAKIIAANISSRQTPATWIKSLLISTKFGEDNGLERLARCLSGMSNLRELRLETPDCNQKAAEDRVGWIRLQRRYEIVFEAASIIFNPFQRCLPNLESCTLHFVDSHKEIYLLSDYAMLFLHPNLRNLTMSCASTNSPELLLPQWDLRTYANSTALEYLHLEECDIYGPTLALLLSFSKCLRHFKLSEGVRYAPRRGFHPRLHGDINPADLVDALDAHCQQSLEWLSLSLGYTRARHQSINQHGQHLDLSSFSNIKYLELDMRTVFLLIPLRTCDHQLWKRIPPALTGLKVFDIIALSHPPFTALGRDYWPLHDCIIRSKSTHGLPHLARLTYSYITHAQEDSDPLEESDPDRDDHPMRQQFNIDDDNNDEEFPEVETNLWTRTKASLVAAAATSWPVYRGANVGFEVVLVSLPTGFIPPYLHNEERPKERCVFLDGRPL